MSPDALKTENQIHRPFTRVLREANLRVMDKMKNEPLISTMDERTKLIEKQLNVITRATSQKSMESSPDRSTSLNRGTLCLLQEPTHLKYFGIRPVPAS